MGVKWTKDQQEAIENGGGTLLVSAAAGSGKTAVLVERVLRRVTDPEHPCDIDSFLIVTFTKAAASEMRGKIADALTALAAERPHDVRLRKQLMLVHHAKITTVHAFCMSLLREHFHEIGLPPDFRTADESEQKMMQLDVLEDVLEQQYAREEEGFSVLVDVLSAGRDDRRLTEVILQTFRNLQASPYPKQVLEGYKERFVHPFDRLADTDWGRELLHLAQDQVAYAKAALEDALDEMESAPDVQEKYAPAFLDDYHNAQTIETLIADGAWNAAVEQCLIMRSSRKRLASVRGYGDPAFLDRIKQAREVWKDVLFDLTDSVFCMSEEEVRLDMDMMAPAVCALCDTVQAFMEAYQQEKMRRGVVDFNDLEHFAVELLLEDDGSPSKLANDMHFTEIMVDEYQDTNAVQDAIFRAVSDNESNIFMVGDVKQSIYRFRLANPGIFLHKYLSYQDAACVTDDSPRRIVLSKNFRSRPEVLDSVNYLFRVLMSERLGDLDYTDKEALYEGRPYENGTDDYRTEFCMLETNTDDEDAPEAIRQEADYCAERIRTMLSDGFQVTDKQTGVLRPCRPEDFVILLRSAKNKAPVFQKALEACGIPVSADMPDDIMETPEVWTLLSWLDIVDNPRQDVALIAAMTSPLGGFTEQELAEIRLLDKEHDFYTALCTAAQEQAKVHDFVQQLNDLRMLAADLPVRQLLWHIVDVTGAMGIFGAMPGGRTRQHHITALTELAGSFEQSGSRGLFAFVRYLRELRATEGTITLPESEEAAGAVRIMTIHKSKGLEFPIVILANCAKKFNVLDLQNAVLLHEDMGISMRCRDVARGIQYDGLDRRAMAAVLRREMASEELRVLYVAMTRAKEKLICTCAVKSAEKLAEKWASVASLQPIPSYALAGQNQYAVWIGVPLMRHPQAIELRQLCSQAPEMDLDAPDCFIVHVVPYQHIDGSMWHEPDGQFAEREKLTAPELKPYAQDVLRDLPSKLTATAMTDSFRAQETQEETKQPVQHVELRRPFFDRSARGLTPSEIGTAHHLFLQFCDFALCEREEGRQAELQRLRDRHILSDLQADAIDLEHIAAFFHSDLYARMKQAKQVHREFKFSVLVPAKDYYAQAVDFAEEQVLLQGVIDCMIELEDSLIVIDFKTDRVSKQQMTQRAQKYKAQLAAYRRAAQLVFHKPVSACALFFLQQGETVWIKETS